jgi:hypothetical protein
LTTVKRVFVSLGCENLCVIGLQRCLCLRAARFFVFGLEGFLCLWAARVFVCLGWKGLCVLGLQECFCLWVARVCFWAAWVFVALVCKNVCVCGLVVAVCVCCVQPKHNKNLAAQRHKCSCSLRRQTLASQRHKHTCSPKTQRSFSALRP